MRQRQAGSQRQASAGGPGDQTEQNGSRKKERGEQYRLHWPRLGPETYPVKDGKLMEGIEYSDT